MLAANMMAKNAGGPSGPLTWTYVGVATSTTATCAFHANAVAGDVALLYYTDQSSADMTLPAGWTTVHSSDEVFERVGGIKVLDASDISTGSVDVGDSTSFQNAACYIVRPSSPVNNLYTGAVTMRANSAADPVSFNILPLNNGASVCLAQTLQYTANTGFSVSPTPDDTNYTSKTNAQHNTAIWVQNDGDSSVTVDCGDGGSYNMLAGFRMYAD